MAGDHEDDEDPQLKSLRQVWLSMRDEDPPSRGLDALMAAARSQVEVLAKPTLWQRIIAALRSPPILALATVMILIGGVVLFTRHSDELERAPTAPSTLPDQSKPTERDRELHSVPATPPAVKLAVPADPTDKDVQHVQVPHAVPRPTTSTAGRSHETAPMTDDGFAGRNQDSMPRPSGQATSAGEAKTDAKKATTSPPNEVLVEQLATQARSAATRGDCETARSIEARIARQDASYYREHVASDLSACAASTTLDAR
jgi:hypothetical protein